MYVDSPPKNGSNATIYVRQGDGRISTHADHTERRSGEPLSMTFTWAHLYGNVYIPVDVARALADSFHFGLLREQSSHKLMTPMNRREKI